MKQKPKDPLTVRAGQQCYELGRQKGIGEALEVVLRYFSNDYSGVDAMRELRKLLEPK